jgi:CubicO group peptidase (beta-lactamase class C family)
MLTSVAIAQLVQAGKLRYTDTLAKILPDYPNREAASRVTLAQILTHTAGLGDFFTEEFMAHKERYRALADYVSLFANQPLRFEPGTSWAYSNGGFLLLGLIVQKASGQDYYDYVKEHIYDPAGMTSSGSTPKDRFPPEMAVGYTRQGGPDGSLQSNYETLPWRGSSAGGGESTVGDLLRFATALRGYKLLNRDLTDLVTTGKVNPDPEDPESRYAYGFEDRRDGGRRTIGHGGGAPGMNGMLQIYWDEGYTVVVLANLDPPAAQQVAEYIRTRLARGAAGS